MQRPDIAELLKAYKRNEVSLPVVMDALEDATLESHEDGEPFIIEAGKFDPETMERQSASGTWKSEPFNVQRGPGRLEVVRNKVREEVRPRFVVDKAEDDESFPYNWFVIDTHRDQTITAKCPNEKDGQAYADWRNGQEQ